MNNVMDMLVKLGYDAASIGNDVLPCTLSQEGKPVGFLMEDFSVQLLPEHEGKRESIKRAVSFALDNQGLEVVQNEFKLSQYQNVALTTSYDYDSEQPIFNIYRIDEDQNLILLNSLNDKQTATKDFAARSGLVSDDIPAAVRDANRLDQFIASIKKRGFSLSSPGSDAFRAYDIVNQENKVVGYIGKNNLVTITSENSRVRHILTDAYIDTKPNSVLLPSFFEKLKERLKEIGLALKVIFSRSGRHYTIQNKRHQEIATVNEQQQVNYTDQATKEQMAKIDAMVEEIRRDNLSRQQVSQIQEPEKVYEQTIPAQSTHDISQDLSNERIQKLTSTVLTNTALAEQIIRLVLSDPQVYSQINSELAGKLTSLSEPELTPEANQPTQHIVSAESKSEQLRQEFNQYLDLLNTVEGFNQERFDEIQKEMTERFGTYDPKVFEEKLRHGDYKVPETLPEKLKVSHERAERQNAAATPDVEQTKEQIPEKERA